MNEERLMVMFLTLFSVYCLGGVVPALVAHHAGHEWVLVAWAIPILLTGVVVIMFALFLMWTGDI